MRLQRGFTLLEVLVAAAVMGIACTALFGLLSRSIFNLGKIEDLHRYQLAGENVMTRVLQLTALPPGAEVSGTVENLDAQWRVSVSPYGPPDLESKPPAAIMKVDVEIFWPGRSGQRNVKLEALKRTSINYDAYDFGDAIEQVFPR